MSKEKQCECCHEWWYDSDVKKNLCPNCYDYFKQLKQQLAEKDKEIAHLKEKDNYHLRYELAGADETITNLKQQLEEKDKEIEKLKQELEETNAGYDFTYEQSSEAIKELKQNQTQLAIQELEKVKILIQNAINFVRPNFVEVYDAINKQIKGLKGEKDVED